MGWGTSKYEFRKDLCMKKQNAFTLAEVLITLGIIGVVAAMTMPSLLNATQNKQYVTAYKRALATMSQAGAMNYALEDTDFETATDVVTVLKNRMNIVKVDKDKLYFNDGVSVTVPSSVKGCKELSTKGDLTTGTAACYVSMDVNGEKGPNVSGKDQYTILFTNQGVVPGDAQGEYILQNDKLDESKVGASKNTSKKPAQS